MNIDKLSPEESFELITHVIAQARNKFEENGFVYMFWGVLIAIASIGQFVLLKNEFYSINYYPYFLLPFGGIYTGYYFYKKEKNTKQNQISKIVSYTWIALSINMMILGFLFSPLLKENLIPVILLLLSLGILISGVSINSRLLLFSGMFINLSAFLCFYIDWAYQPLLMGIVSIIAVLIPGILLMLQHKGKQNV